MRSERCVDCGAPQPSFTLTGVGAFCDRCADRRIAATTGWPVLPDRPEPLVITGPDRRKHTLRYRLWRAPTGISVDLIEDRRDGSEGYEFRVLGAHDADLNLLIENVRQQAITEINQPYLRGEHRIRQWVIATDEVAGRVSFDPDGGPCRVVIDGRDMQWDDLGRILASYEGWRFRLTLTDACHDLRPDADVLPLPTQQAEDTP